MKLTDNLTTSLLIRGDDTHAFRDPAVIYDNGLFKLWCTLVETEPDGKVYMYICYMTSNDLVSWTEPVKLTPRDRSLNYSSPGNVVRFNDKYIICFQSYCRENGEKYGNERCRLFIAESTDAVNWSEPRALKVKGNAAGIDGCGRMIDPYLIEHNGLWYCFYKHNGICYSTSSDLIEWNFVGRINGGENPSIIKNNNEYRLFYSPENGIAARTSYDLINWKDVPGLLTFGQSDWEWARGRITAGTVVKVGEQWLMFFHGTGPEDESVIFDTNACIGVAWSDDLVHWSWK